MKSTRATIQIDAETHAMLKAYSDQTGIPIGKVVARAIRECLQGAGRKYAEALASK
jgi:hypothetical protein